MNVISGEEEPTEEGGEEQPEEIQQEEVQDEGDFVESSSIDTGLKMQEFLIKPTAEENFPWITKDMAIGYLDELDKDQVRKLCNLINTLENMGLHGSAKLFYGDLASLLVSSRASHGFERQMQQTAIQKGFQYFDQQEEKKNNLLGGK